MMFRGQEFKSQEEAAKSIGVSVNTIWSRMRNHKYSFEDAARDAVRPKGAPRINNHPKCEYMGEFDLSAKLMKLPFNKWQELI